MHCPLNTCPKTQTHCKTQLAKASKLSTSLTGVCLSLAQKIWPSLSRSLASLKSFTSTPNSQAVHPASLPPVTSFLHGTYSRQPFSTSSEARESLPTRHTKQQHMFCHHARVSERNQSYTSHREQREQHMASHVMKESERHSSCTTPDSAYGTFCHHESRQDCMLHSGSVAGKLRMLHAKCVGNWSA